MSLGLKALLADLGAHVRIRRLTDATTCQAIAASRGLGKIPHLDIAQLWVRQLVNDGTLEVVKIQNDFHSGEMHGHLGPRTQRRTKFGCTATEHIDDNEVSVRFSVGDTQ